MRLVNQIHENMVYGRRANVLANSIRRLIPLGARVLDVGCGDGLISKLIVSGRPDLEIEGVDVLLRPTSHIPVRQYDGEHLPYSDNSFDVVTFTDVLHHTDDPSSIIAEANRVAGRALIIKDHTRNGLLAGPTLHFMDWVGNARHGVAIPANYWPRQKWHDEFARLGLSVSHWTQDIALYPWWADWVFGRSLHFIVELKKQNVATQPDLQRRAA